jgi:hypothetical protein
MSVFVITINDQTFDKKSAEVQHIAKCLEVAAAEIQRGQGTVTSGTITHQSPSGAGHTSLGSWTYSPSASRP